MDILKTINPATGKLLGETPISTLQDLQEVVSKARKAFEIWRKTPVQERATYLRKYLDLITEHSNEIAKLTSGEMGKPLTQSRDDMNTEKSFIEYYFQKGPEFLAPEKVHREGVTDFKVVYEPYGVCACIAPWNFPYSMFNSGVLPALLAGNTVVFKPSEYTTLTQKRCLELLQQTGIPDGVVNLVVGTGDVGKMLIDQDINLVWFTGSTKVGREIYENCGRKFIKGIVELGGSSPGIVFPDANIDDAIEQLYWARFLNCGQVCNAVKRLFVHESIFDQVVEKIVKQLKDKIVGNPFDDVDFGPLVSKKQLELLESQVKDAIEKGAKVEIGGKRPDGKDYEIGNYYLPTVLTNVSWDMRMMTEETFGPVLPIIPFKTDEEVVEMANKTPYGLSAEIYTSNIKKGQKIAQNIESGVVAINTDSFYYPPCPVGGYKMSGIGREYGKIGIQEFAQVKLVAVRRI